MNPDGSSDKNLYNLNLADGAEQDFCDKPTSPSDASYTGIFKYTGQQKGPLKVLAATVVGARETLVDVNNGASNAEFTAGIWDVSPCKYGFSVKGGAQNIALNGVVRGQSKECEVFFGNWSDQDHEPSSGKLNLKHENGTPIRIRYFDDTVAFAPGSGPYKVIFPWAWLPFRGIIRRVFNQLRRWGFFR